VAPRRYEMHARATSVEQRRQRMLAAAIDVFAERTASATSMEDVAAAAGVSAATVYRQFGDFEGLAQACAKTAFNIAEVPTPETAAAQFASLPDLETKLRRFVEMSCDCYQRAGRWLAAERRERHLPAFARTVAREEDALDAIVRGLLEPVHADPTSIAAVKALCDFPFWQSLRASGVSAAEAPGLIHRLAVHLLTDAGIQPNTNRRKSTHARHRA
jgi:AcrR family transcriptional regulator